MVGFSCDASDAGHSLASIASPIAGFSERRTESNEQLVSAKYSNYARVLRYVHEWTLLLHAAASHSEKLLEGWTMHMAASKKDGSEYSTYLNVVFWRSGQDKPKTFLDPFD